MNNVNKTTLIDTISTITPKSLTNNKKMYHIKPYLKRRGFNITALAQKMNMSFQRFDHHIKPKDDLSFNFLIQLSDIIDITLDDLINEIKLK